MSLDQEKKLGTPIGEFVDKRTREYCIHRAKEIITLANQDLRHLAAKGQVEFTTGINEKGEFTVDVKEGSN